MLIGGEPNKIDEGSGSVVFLWEGEKWYDEFAEIAFVGELMSREQVLTLLKFQWIKHLELAEYQGGSYAMTLSGHTGQSITIGGFDKDGNDASTELEELLLETQIQMKNIQPTLTLLYHPKLKDSYMHKVVECIRGGSGQPQILNNNVVIQRTMYFWLTGILSSFLDNAPTYLVFFNTAGGDAQYLMQETPTTLAAISAGAVFMGANSYIGNAPNFMVRSIAESSGVRMPGFFGYMAWSAGILLPLFGILTWLFFA